MFKRVFRRDKFKNIARWFRDGVFKKKPKETSLKPSIDTIFRNKIKKSKLHIKDIELIEGMTAKELKKRFSVTGSRAQALERMVADYKRGALSLPGLSHKSKFDAKSLDRARIHKIISEYNKLSSKTKAKEAKICAKDMKMKFNLSKSEAKILDKMIAELNKGSKKHLMNTLLDPKKLTKERVEKLIVQYKEAKQINRGVSYLMTKSNTSFIHASLGKMRNLKEDVKGLKGLSAIIKKHG